MSSVIEGNVEFVKKNDHGYYAVKMDDGQWYGCGKEQPEFNKGDAVRFEVVTNGRYLNVDESTVEVLEKNAAPQRSAPSRSAPARKSGGSQKFSNATSKDDYWKAKETRDIARDERLQKRDINTQNEIRLQASRNAAIELIGVAINAKVIEFPEEKKKGKNFDVLTTYVDKLTEKFYNETKAINKAEDVAEPEQGDVEETQDEGEDFNDDIKF